MHCFSQYYLFIHFIEPPFMAQETLKAWQNKNHPWLELSDVHKETTENIRVTVIPFYMGCRESHATSVYWVSRNLLLRTILILQIETILILFYFLVEILHQIRKFGIPQCSVKGATLENIFIVWYIGNS